ncbi:TetR/AcrR family transcriptional regulator [Pantoea sp. KPR_PJ]|uniref:TetR/AcrR family transcriptional regulator n=1 Tax=Pantoea sp. KPR_PJ TaxID=2738375 RepID=UPI003528F60B
MTGKRRADTMEENRVKLIAAARKAFAEKGFAAASMDDLTASVNLTRGALYHHFGDKKGLLAAVVNQIDSEMAQHASQAAADVTDGREKLLAEGVAYIRSALDEEVRRIVLLDGPAFLGNPAQWPGQNSCLDATRKRLASMAERGEIKAVDPAATAFLLNSAAFNAAQWIAASEDPQQALPRVIAVFTLLVESLRPER